MEWVAAFGWNRWQLWSGIRSHRRRRKPEAAITSTAISNTMSTATGPNLVELAFEQHYAKTPEEDV